MQNISVIAQLKKKNGSGYIFIRAFINRKPVKAASTGYRIDPVHWDIKNHRVVDSGPNASLINLYLQQKLQFIQAEILKREISQQRIDKRTLGMIITGGNTADFILYARQVIRTKKFADGSEYTLATKNRYEQEITRLEQFRSSINFKDITPEFLDEYKKWMQAQTKENGQKKLHPNSIWKALGTIRMVWNEAAREKMITEVHSPFRDFKVGTYKRDIEKIKYLELAHIDMIESVLISRADYLDRLTLQVGWRFLFMCVTGMRISDARLFTDRLLKGSDILEFQPYKTRRSANTAQVPIANERQQRYLQKTLAYSIPIKELGTMRKMFNDELRVIAQLAGIMIRVTSHVGRHTMGSFLVDGNVDHKAAKAILGVKSDDVMNTYMHLKASKLLSEGKKLDAVF
jgi:site-specific recombinase XerD